MNGKRCEYNKKEGRRHLRIGLHSRKLWYDMYLWIFSMNQEFIDPFTRPGAKLQHMAEYRNDSGG